MSQVRLIKSAFQIAFKFSKISRRNIHVTIPCFLVSNFYSLLTIPISRNAFSPIPSASRRTFSWNFSAFPTDSLQWNVSLSENVICFTNNDNEEEVLDLRSCAHTKFIYQFFLDSLHMTKLKLINGNKRGSFSTLHSVSPFCKTSFQSLASALHRVSGTCKSDVIKENLT